MKNLISLILIAGLFAISGCKENNNSKSNENMLTTASNNNLSEQDLTDFKTAQTNRKIVDTEFKKWAEGTGNFFDLLDENVVWRVTGKAPYSATYNGKKEFMDKAVVPINKFLSTKITPELVDINASKDIVWLQWKGKADAVDKSQYINEYAWKLKFNSSGKIISADAFLDTYALGKLVEN